MFESSLLSVITLGPAVAALVMLLLPDRNPSVHRWFSLVVSGVGFLLSLLVWFRFDPENSGFQFVEQISWIPQFGISYHVGVDGISLLLILLTTVLVPVVILASWTSNSIVCAWSSTISM